jgi:hypothetical protein
MEVKIFYTGVGSTKNEYSEREFLEIMKNEFTDKNWDEVPYEKKLRQLQCNEWNLPNDFILFTLLDWIEYSGANIIIN